MTEDLKFQYRNVEKELEQYRKQKREKLIRLKAGEDMSVLEKNEYEQLNQEASSLPKYREKLNISLDIMDHTHDGDSSI